MKNLLFLMSLILLEIPLFAQPRIYRIEGKFENAVFISDTLYVCKIDHILDFYSGNSALIIKKVPIINGTFSFSLSGDSIERGIIRFNIQPKNTSNGATVRRGGSGENCCFLILEDNELIRITADLLDFTSTFEVSPGGDNNSLKELRNIMVGRKKLADSISTLLSKSVNEPANLDQLKSIYYDRLLADRAALQIFVDTVKNVYSKFIGLHQMDIPHSLNDSTIYNYCTSLLVHLSSKRADTLLVSSFRQLLKRYDKVSYNISNLLKARYKNSSGQWVEVTLRKRLTIIDFWASWCEPCRKANRSELQVINDLAKTRDFEIISISLDKEFPRWLEASAKDKITWKNYFDPLNFQSEYINELQIKELPSAFLIDINGNVIARDMVLVELIKLLK